MDKLVLYANSGYLVRDSINKQLSLPRGTLVNGLTVLTNDKNAFSTTDVSLTPDSVTKGDVSVEGKIIDSNSSSVTIITEEGEITIRKYDMIFRGVYIVSSSTDFRLGAVVKGLSWLCTATCILREDTENHIHFIFNATVYNGTGSNIESDVTLVAGKPNIPTEDVTPRTSAKMSMASYETRSFHNESVEEEIPAMGEYVTYNIGKKILTDTSIVKIFDMDVLVSKFYKFVTQSSGVSVGYQFKAPDRIPGCKADLFNEDMSILLGGSRLKEYQKGEDVEFIVGETSRVRCICKLERSQVSDVMTLDINSVEYGFDLLITHYVGARPIRRVMPTESIDHEVKEGWLRIFVHIEEEIEKAVITVEYID